MERRLAEQQRPLRRGEVWAVRLGMPLILMLAVGLGVGFGTWGGMGAPLVMIPIQWLRMTPHQRAQVIGRATV